MKKKLVVLISTVITFVSCVAWCGFGSNDKVFCASVFQKIDFVDAKVMANYLNVRQGPSTTKPVICTLQKGQIIKVFGKIGDWYAIYEPGGKCVGAVSSQYITIMYPTSKVTPVPTVKPAPTKVPVPTAAPAPTKSPEATAVPVPTKVPVTTKVPVPTSKPVPTAVPMVTSKPAPTNVPSEGVPEVSQEEQEMLALVNKARVDGGVGPLKFDANLQKTARLKAKDMVDNNYFSHQSPTYGSPFDMMRQFGISFKTAGENIAGNQTVNGAFNAWMNSEGHRKNILNGNYNYTGIGIVSGSQYGKIFVQQFIGR